MKLTHNNRNSAHVVQFLRLHAASVAYSNVELCISIMVEESQIYWISIILYLTLRMIGIDHCVIDTSAQAFSNRHQNHNNSDTLLSKLSSSCVATSPRYRYRPESWNRVVEESYLQDNCTGLEIKSVCASCTRII